MSWKDSLDRRLERKKQERIARANLSLEERKRINWDKLQKYARSHKCHMCGVRGIGAFANYSPGRVNIHGESEGGSTWRIVNLHVCRDCGKYACTNHYHSGYCKKCAKKV